MKCILVCRSHMLTIKKKAARAISITHREVKIDHFCQTLKQVRINRHHYSEKEEFHCICTKSWCRVLDFASAWTGIPGVQGVCWLGQFSRTCQCGRSGQWPVSALEEGVSRKRKIFGFKQPNFIECLCVCACVRARVYNFLLFAQIT